MITVSGGRPFTAASDVLPSTHRPVLPSPRRPNLAGPRLLDGPRRLGQGRSRRHQVVDQHHQPLGQKSSATGNHGQRAREIVQPLPGVEPRLVGHHPPLPQDGHHPHRHPRPPQLSRCSKGDPPRRIMPPGPNGPPRGRHRNEQDGHTDPVPCPSATDTYTRPRATGPGSGSGQRLTPRHATCGQPLCPRRHSAALTPAAAAAAAQGVYTRGVAAPVPGRLDTCHVPGPGQSRFTCPTYRPRPPGPADRGHARTRPTGRVHKRPRPTSPPHRRVRPTSLRPVKAPRAAPSRSTPLQLPTTPGRSPTTPLPGPPRPLPGRSLTPRPTHLPHARPHSPRQSRTERRRKAQRPPLLVGQQHRPYRIRVPSRRVHDRQSGRLRHRSHPARRGPVQGGTALRTERRARLPAASALGRQHQIGEVLPPPAHAHHCANAEADRPPLWITPCGKPCPVREQQFPPQLPALYS